MNFLDLVILGVIGLSSLLAFSRGFIKEMLSILGWIGAVIATVVFLNPVRQIVGQYVANEIFASLAAGIGIFVVTLFLCGLVNHWISSHVRGAGLGALDRSLGLVFGLLRGALVVCAAFILMAWFEPNRPEWPDIVKSARLLPTVDRSATYLLSLLPEDMLKAGEDAINQSLKAVEQGQAAGETYQSVLPDLLNQSGSSNLSGTNATGTGANGTNAGTGAGAGAQEPGGQDDGSGYKDVERNDLNRLIQGSE